MVAVMVAVVVAAGAGVAVPTASSANASEIRVFFTPEVVREGHRFVNLVVWNRQGGPTCAPLSVTVNRIYPAAIQSFRPPDGWTWTLGNEARATSPTGLAPDESGVIRMWVDAQTILPWRSAVFEAEVWCGSQRIASGRLDVAR